MGRGVRTKGITIDNNKRLNRIKSGEVFECWKAPGQGFIEGYYLTSLAETLI